MLISHTKQFIFVHIYKNAGSSIGAALLPYAYPPLYRALNPVLRRVGCHRWNPIPCKGHAPASEIKRVVGKSVFERYTKFAVVRNPWDWQLSLYTYMLKEPNQFQHKIVSQFKTFDEYLDWRVRSDFHTQTEYITDESGVLLVDDLLRFERLSDDFAELCHKLGLDCTLPHLNRSKAPGYRDSYSGYGRRLVEDAFRLDIERYGYEF